MFDLFKLSRLVTYVTEPSIKKDNYMLNCYAYEDTVDRSLLCLYFTSGKLFIWQREYGHVPLSCWLPWFPRRDVTAMCIDPTGAWLLLLCADNKLHVMCVRNILDPSANVDQLWRLDDVTYICDVPPNTGGVSCMKWWKTMCGDNVVVMGTKVGYVVLLDLVRRTELLQRDLNEHIVDVQLLRSDSFTHTQLLVNTKGNNQWRLLLEEKLEFDLSLIQDSAYFPIEQQYSTIYHVCSNADEVPETFQPHRIFHFSSHVVLSPQQARGRGFIGAHDLRTGIYRIFPSSLDGNALFMYRLPAEVDHVIYTDKLMFTSSPQEGAMLLVLANQSAEISTEDAQDFAGNCCVQTFHLDPGECVLGMYKKSFPYNWHEKQPPPSQQSSKQEAASKTSPSKDVNEVALKEGGSLLEKREAASQKKDKVAPGKYEPASQEDKVALSGIKYRSHTVFDGCVMVTSKAVYECRPRLSPEHLFVHLSLGGAPVEALGSLGVLAGVDMSYLAWQVAEGKLRQGQSGYADRLMGLAKVTSVERCLLYAKYDMTGRALTLGREILSSRPPSGESVSEEELCAVSAMCVRVAVLQVLRSRDDRAEQVLRELLLRRADHVTVDTWKLLYTSDLHHVMWEVARAGGRVNEVVDLYIQNRSLTLTSHSGNTDDLHMTSTHPGVNTDDLHMTSRSEVNTDYLHMTSHSGINTADLHMTSPHPDGPKVNKCITGCMTSLLTGSDVMWLLEHDPTTFTHLLELLEDKMAAGLGRSRTLQVAGILNPAQSITAHFLDKVLALRISGAERGLWDRAVDLVMLFFTALLHIEAPLVTPNTQPNTQENPSASERVSVRCRPSLLSCSSHWSAVILDRALYMWGRSYNPSAAADVKKMEFPGNPSVLSVTCGYQNVVAVTDRGVYSWGSGLYGSLGIGDAEPHHSPQPVYTLAEEYIVQVACGQYHSLALTENGRVYSWGWGAHGQCGHGHVEDVWVPTVIAGLQGCVVVRVCAGHAHSAVLTREGQGSVYVFGCNVFGQLGLGDAVKRSLPTQIISFSQPITDIHTQHFHTVCVTRDRLLYHWGVSPLSLKQQIVTYRRSGRARALTMAEQNRHLAPVLLPRGSLSHKVNIAQVSCGLDLSVIVTGSGEMYSWGRNSDGQLGIGTKHTREERRPVPLVKISDRCIQQVACGPDYVIAMDTQGQLWGWGRNDYGQVGVALTSRQVRLSRDQTAGSHDQCFVFPVQIPLPEGAKVRVQVPAKTWEVLLLDADRRRLHTLVTKQQQCDVLSWGPDSLAEYLQGLSVFVNLHVLLRSAVKLCNYGSASVICQHTGSHGDAFMYTLRAIRLADGDGWIAQVETVLTNTLRKLSSVKGKAELYSNILQQLSVWWLDQGLPVGVLERVLTPHLTHTSHILLTNLIQNEQTNLEGVTFSPEFVMRLTSTLLAELSNGKVNGKHLLNKLHLQVAPSSGLTGALPHDRLRSAERAWCVLTHNLQGITTDTSPAAVTEKNDEDITTKLSQSISNEEKTRKKQGGLRFNKSVVCISSETVMRLREICENSECVSAERDVNVSNAVIELCSEPAVIHNVNTEACGVISDNQCGEADTPTTHGTFQTSKADTPADGTFQSDSLFLTHSKDWKTKTKSDESSCDIELGQKSNLDGDWELKDALGLSSSEHTVVVMFSCGHTTTKAAFKRQFVSAGEGGVANAGDVDTLYGYFTQVGAGRIACPCCVHQKLRNL